MHMLVFALLFEHHAIPCTLCFPCANPGFFVRGGVRVNLTKKARTTFFFSPQLILLKSNGSFRRKLSFFKVPEGVQHFPGGSNCLYPIETHITCDFPGGGADPLTPLWIRTCYLDQQEIAFFRLVVVGWYFSVLFKF